MSLTCRQGMLRPRRYPTGIRVTCIVHELRTDERRLRFRVQVADVVQECGQDAESVVFDECAPAAPDGVLR